MKLEKTTLSALTFISILYLLSSGAAAQDWPVYKGNLYLTGNNDEIVVKNNRIKWIQKSGAPLYNPVVSEGKIYIIDKAAVIFCLDEETGEVLWKQSLTDISREFTGTDKTPGKIKYPVIKDRFLIISDATMIYAFDKNTGHVIWSRTALQNEKNPEKFAKKSARGIIEGIYSDPTIHDDEIFYGTRSVFIARSLADGHLIWNREDIKSYSGFPVFYDDFILTQSMDYSTGKYYLYNLDLKTGGEHWIVELEKPFKIFSPVVYDKKVFLPIGMKIYALDLITGKILWLKDYKEYVTSEISFADREIVFSINNKDVVSADTETGEIKSRIAGIETASPYFVITQDQVYIAANFNPDLQAPESKDRPVAGAGVKAFIKNESAAVWEFRAPFPGSVSQPVSSKGVLFLPAGNYLYALGSVYPSELIKDGDDFFLKKTDEKGNVKKLKLFEKLLSQKEPKKIPESTPDIPKRPIRLSVLDEDGKPVKSDAEIILRKNGKIVYNEKLKIDKDRQEIKIPDPADGAGEVEINFGFDDHAPQKVVINKEEIEKTVVTAKIAKGGGFSLDNIGFETDKAYLKEDSVELLNRTVELLNKHPDFKMEIRGHTDSAGDDNYNQALSEKRAEAVREYLVKHGISPLRLTARGFGETKPVADNATAEGRAKNRRTEFYILK